MTPENESFKQKTELLFGLLSVQISTCQAKSFSTSYIPSNFC